MSGGAPAAAPPWRPRDCHAHTTCSDGALAPAELVTTVRARGARPSIADHLSRDVGAAVKSPEAVGVYLDVLTALRNLAPDLAISAEFCWHDHLWRELDAPTFARFTHTVGSLHAVRLPDGAWQHMFAPRMPAGLDVDAYMDAHVAELERFCAAMPVEILAHPTLLPMPLRERPLEELWTEAREERAVRALAGAGICFEVSNRYRPHARFVARAVAGGVRLSLGSDGHGAGQVGDVAWPLESARAAGARDADLYEPTVHGRRAPLPR